MSATPEHLNLRRLDDGFGHYLAGLIDGEGCFTIPRASARPDQATHSYQCRFELGLRDDDLAILEEIQQRTGLGRLSPRSGKSSSRRNRPSIRWDIGSRRDCAGLVQILDRYPLRAKKAADYAIWRRAVSAWLRLSTSRYMGPERWDEIAALSTALRAIRAYDGAPVALPTSFQLALVGSGR